jgi:tRNA(fMet)-specific endonuclease VapC
MIVADSDVLIDFLRGREPGTGVVASEIATGRLTTTAINVFELLSGVRTKTERAKIDKLLDALTIHPIDQATSAAAAEIRCYLEEKGEGIGTADYLIAAVCLIKQATLLTRNEAHFGRVPKLSLRVPTANR